MKEATLNWGALDARPTVSVVVPTHNRPALLERALLSVLQSEFPDFEIVVSNNGRPEDTRSLQGRVRDPRVRWVEQSPSLDLLENFLAGVSLARGKWVAVLHDDDWVHPNYLATLIPPLEATPDAVLAFTNPLHVDPAGNVDTEEEDYFTRRRGLDKLAQGFHRPFTELVLRETIRLPGCIFRREAVSPADVPRQAGPAHDIWLVYLLARTGGAAYFCGDRLFYYTVHRKREFEDDPLPYLRGAVYCEQRMLADPRMAPYRTALTQRLAGRHRWLGASLLRRGARRAARAHLAAALRLRPTAKDLAGWGASWVIPKSVLARL
jgi:glycosyltransferase involved in cell wall biosynthesis